MVIAQRVHYGPLHDNHRFSAGESWNVKSYSMSYAVCIYILATVVNLQKRSRCSWIPDAHLHTKWRIWACCQIVDLCTVDLP